MLEARSNFDEVSRGWERLRRSLAATAFTAGQIGYDRSTDPGIIGVQKASTDEDHLI